ncbi:hypothetical protein J6590_053941 [Homalodisca vitripennis]|nr:hypothetical protein J6590_053941 [Homalodisca vitripennis]
MYQNEQVTIFYPRSNVPFVASRSGLARRRDEHTRCTPIKAPPQQCTMTSQPMIPDIYLLKQLLGLERESTHHFLAVILHLVINVHSATPASNVFCNIIH